jgi:hypothetical protein
MQPPIFDECEKSRIANDHGSAKPETLNLTCRLDFYGNIFVVAVAT